MWRWQLLTEIQPKMGAKVQFNDVQCEDVFKADEDASLEFRERETTLSRNPSDVCM